MNRPTGQIVGAFVCGLSLGAMGRLLLSPQSGRRTRIQLAERLADLYYELEPRLVAVRVQDIVLDSRVRSALRSTDLEEGVSLNVWGRRVHLRGTVQDAETIQQVEAIVRAVPGVRKVVNHLWV